MHLSQSIRNMPIRIRIFLFTFVTVAISMVLMNYAVSHYYANQMIDNEFTHIVESSSNTKNSLETILYAVVDMGDRLQKQDDILALLRKRSTGSFNPYLLSQQLKSYVYVQPAVTDVCIMDLNGNFYASDSNMTADDALKLYGGAALALDDGSEYAFFVDRKYQYQFSKPAIRFARRIVDPATDAPLGIAVIILNYEYFNEIFSKSCISKDQKAFIVTPDGVVLCNNPIYTIYTSVIEDNPQLLTSRKTQSMSEVFGLEALIVSDTLDLTDWKVVKMLSVNAINKGSESIRTVSVIISVFLLLLTLAFTAILSRSITKPIQRMNEKFKEVEQGRLGVSLSVTSRDEFGQLSTSFNSMVRKLKELIANAVEDEKKKAELEYQILQSQINPHFLYNTLDSIKWLASMHNAHSVCEMAGALIHLLKYTISNTETVVSLEDELNSIAKYIIIQKYRYGDVFIYDYDIQPESNQCQVLRFMLQPLVENSMLHGFDDAQANGRILISSRIEGDLLYVEVEDNGQGAPSKELDLIGTKAYKGHRFSGIGLKNINERIRLQFGALYGLTPSNLPGGGFKVTIVLPCKPYEPPEARK